MPTRARLTFIFTALFGVVVIALGITSYLFVRNDAYLRLDGALQVAMDSTAMSFKHEFNEHSTKHGGELDVQLVLNEATSPAMNETEILVREGDRNVAYKPSLQRNFDLRGVRNAALPGRSTREGFRVASRTFFVPKFGATYRIFAAKPVADALARVQWLCTALLIVIPIGLIFAGWAGYRMASRTLAPLKDLAQTVETISSHDLSARVRISNRGDEIQRLAARFNALLDRLEDSFMVQRRFMADASHQLRTPLTVALTAAQVTDRDGRATVWHCRETLRLIETQLRQLRRTVEDMFFLSQDDSSSLKFHCEPVYLDDVVSEAVQSAKTLGQRKGQTIRLGTFAEAKCVGDAELLKQAILALLENAVKFMPPGGTIDVQVFEREEHWVCSVTDSGPGISASARERVFERFFRENRVGLEHVPGSGLGLAIAKSIVEKHDGVLRLLESRPGRTTFEIALPKDHGQQATDVQANSLGVSI